MLFNFGVGLFKSDYFNGCKCQRFVFVFQRLLCSMYAMPTFVYPDHAGSQTPVPAARTYMCTGHSSVQYLCV